MISQHYITFPFYIPRIIRLFRNWPIYLINYLSRRQRSGQYWLRNGFRLVDSTGTLTGTIAAVFVRQEYGRLDNFKTIVDIGANMGAFAIYSAWSVPEAKIYCYEPEDNNFKCLQENVAINMLGEHISPFKNAVSSKNGAMELAIAEGDSPLNSLLTSLITINHNKTVCRYQKVDCITLRDIIEKEKLYQIDLLKLNCEGAEYDILESISQADYERIHNIRLEYHNLADMGKNGKYISRQLKTHGYEIQRFTQYCGISGFIWAKRLT